MRHFQNDMLKIALRKLDVLNAADKLDDLRSPPANRLEALKGNLAGFHSIRVNNQWRIIFRWDSGAKDVSLVDYH
jgi:proteic killer suppression protein